MRDMEVVDPSPSLHGLHHFLPAKYDLQLGSFPTPPGFMASTTGQRERFVHALRRMGHNVYFTSGKASSQQPAASSK
jgi:hypothetical protein